MALDLAGIENVEFYSAHYLSAVLEGDLKQVFQRWKQAKEDNGTKPPSEALHTLANPYFQALAKAEGERDPVERWRLARGFHANLVEALGYRYSPAIEPLDGDDVCPVAAAVERNGKPFLWIVDAPFVAEEDDDPFDVPPLAEQLPADAGDVSLPKTSWRELFDERIFRLEDPPRWVLFLSGREIVLVERHKWPQGKLLRFDLGALFSRRQAKALRATAALLHRDVLAPDDGQCLHDTLDESSHKHAFAVSSDLKHGLRRAVELLANEAVWYRRVVQKQGVFNEDEIAPRLTEESLIWLYRLLFLFYVEARGAELDVVPMKSDAYREGYSLESLRDLELVPLTSEDARNGYCLDTSLKTLFRLLNDGFGAAATGLLPSDTFHHDTFEIFALNSPLFDDTRLSMLRGVKFRNHVLQEILQLLSLSAEKKGKTRGRISYAQLGINQLGAVYEGILSYTGFFAHEDLYEVASEKDCKQLSGKAAAERESLKTYFVPSSKIADYKEGEIVKDENGKKVVHDKGSFIFRLAGRNREKSASYYTPEVLTKCLVKYALKELLWEEPATPSPAISRERVQGEGSEPDTFANEALAVDKGGSLTPTLSRGNAGEGDLKPKRKKTADEILALTICEPAMGSSAFLIEAVDQLADAYLEAKQEELDQQIPPEDYQREKRRVKARLATNNCYGVDLNPTAVELAKVSLWLATMHEGGKCPWFGLRLATGNSLIGARREVFKTVDVIRKGTKDDPNWLGLVPEPVPLHHGEDAPPPDEVDWANWTAPARPKGTIYHFLLPAEGMAVFDKDKVIKQLAPESVKRIQSWRKEFCKPFNKKDAERLEQISDAVDRLFAQVVRERVLATQETSDRIAVWGEPSGKPPSAKQADLLVRDQEEVAASLEHGSSAHRRLKLAMDAWCALWFWPIEEAGLLPDRATWLAQMELILKGQVTHEDVWQQQSLFAEFSAALPGPSATTDTPPEGGAPAASAERLKRLQALSDAFRERRADYFNDCGLADIDSVLEGDASMRLAQGIVERLRYHHWPLRFAEVFACRGGFDLILGNPPWIKVGFSESAVLADFVPAVEIHRVAGQQLSKERESILQAEEARRLYVQEFEELIASQSYLGDVQNYHFLLGLKANLYKCFMTRAWDIGRDVGAISFLHPEGVYDDPDGGALRSEIYSRLLLHCQFINELKLFPEIGNRNKFSINCHRVSKRNDAEFRHVSNLFHPSTLEESLRHDGLGPVPMIKGDDDRWELRGHSHRIIRVDEDRLGLFALLYDKPGTVSRRARLPIVHSEEIVSVLQKLSSVDRIGPSGDRWGTTREWNEGDRQEDGTIRRDVQFPSDLCDWIVSGPHMFVGTPLNKTPNEGCDSHKAYTKIDLPSMEERYLPRTVFKRSCGPDEYEGRTPTWNGKSLFEQYRHAHRQMISPTGERSFIPCLLPPGPATIDSVFTAAFSSTQELAVFSALCSSLVVDFFVKSMGKSSIRSAELQTFPLPMAGTMGPLLSARCFRLNCLIEEYSIIWNEQFESSWREDSFVAHDPRFRGSSQLEPEWSSQFAFRSELERRQALVELDVVAAMACGLRSDELQAIYRVQFPVLRQYERSRSYDQHGRIVPTSKTAAGNPAVSLLELAATLKEQAGFDVHAEYHPNGSNTQELRKQKIRLGKKEADVLGVSERCTMDDLLAETKVRWSDEEHPEGRPVRLVGLRYTDPGLEPRMERVYPTPWTRCDREADYRQAWAEFERRLGKKMPEGGC